MGKKHPEGFTLIELLVLMMVLALALGIGVPAFVTMAANNRMSAAANDLLSSIFASRSESLTRNRTVTLCASSNWDAEQPDCGANASLLDGWIVFEDTDNDGAVGSAEPVLQAHGPIDDRIRLQPQTGTDGGATEYVSFRDDGSPQDIPGLPPTLRNIQLCDDRGNQDTGGGRSAGRWIQISTTGRPAVIDTVTHLQGADNPLGGC
jgi:type IV fimbrial biogenesis protein FimT